MTEQAFTVYPAIDILDGQCVRLVKGNYEAKTVYSEDPSRIAAQWCEAGAAFLHVVDLDGAKSGHAVNDAVIRSVVQRAKAHGAGVQVGGGIRNATAIERHIENGVDRVVLGTVSSDVKMMAAFVRTFGSEAIVAGLDGRNGRLAVTGWMEQTDTSIVDLAEQLASVGVRHALVTDVERDGMKTGTNVRLAQEVAKAGLQVIASGGVGSVQDVLAAKRASLSGVIVGKALYDGHFDLADALLRVKEESGC